MSTSTTLPLRQRQNLYKRHPAHQEDVPPTIFPSYVAGISGARGRCWLPGPCCGLSVLGQPCVGGDRDAAWLWAAGVSTPSSGHLPGASLFPQLSTFVGGVRGPAVSPEPAGHFPKSSCATGGESHCNPSIPERPLILSWSHWAWYLRPSGDVSLPGFSPAGPISATYPGL